MSEQAERLTWKERGHYGQTYYGTAGRLATALFSYTWDGVKAEPGRPYVMSTTLPGFSGKRWRGEDGKALEAKAEELFAAWLKAAGVVAEAAS